MKPFEFTRKAAVGIAAVAALATAVPAAVSAENYVLTAGNWGKKQTSAVQAAGGTIVWSHRGAGIGVVTADADFLSRIEASNAFQSAAADKVVQWQPKSMQSEAITPDDETFFGFQWNMQAMDAPTAWANGCAGAGARVAVIDGGIDDTHVDLDDNLDAACSVSFVQGQPFNTDTGTFWHGTHVAGIVAAEDNGIGVIGTAPEAELVHVKALHDGGGSFGAVIGGILYAADPAAFGTTSCARADIINMSLGALFPKSAAGGGQLVGAMAKAVNFASSQGVLVLSSAGNDGLDMRDAPGFTHVPSDSGSGLSVSATGPVDFANGGTNYRRPASYSNFGTGTVAVAAPGGDFTLFPNGLWFLDMVLSTNVGNTYTWTAGTSMASPAAAGVAALIVGNNPGISLGALKAKLQQSADDEGPLDYDAFYGHGFVNAANACSM